MKHDNAAITDSRDCERRCGDNHSGSPKECVLLLFARAITWLVKVRGTSPLVILSYRGAAMFSCLDRCLAIGWNFRFHHAQRSTCHCADVKDDVSCLDMPSGHSWSDSGTSAPSLLRRRGRG